MFSVDTVIDLSALPGTTVGVASFDSITGLLFEDVNRYVVVKWFRYMHLTL